MGNNPVNANDPSGMCPICIPIVEAAAPEITAATSAELALASARLSEYGIQAYNKLRPLIQGLDLEAHHLIEKRFADVLGVNAREMLSMAVTKGEHQALTNLWRSEISYGVGTAKATAESVLNAASRIYQNSPTILKALGLGAAIESSSANASPRASQISVEVLGFGNDASTSAAGGFLLYPNKPNNNQMQAVYSK